MSLLESGEWRYIKAIIIIRNTNKRNFSVKTPFSRKRETNNTTTNDAFYHKFLH